MNPSKESLLVQRVIAARRSHQLPAQLRPLAQAFINQVLGLLFPHFAHQPAANEKAVLKDFAEVSATLELLEQAIASMYPATPTHLGEGFFNGLLGVQDLLVEDAQATYQGDPAARSVDEVMLTYPGFWALAVFRVAHLLHQLGLPLAPRLLTEIAHEKTGIDIHPGARIGKRFCIDHGTGVVIGETTVLGDGVKIYQGVTLGALTVQKSLADRKRHPTIENEVVIYAGATILGGETVVGEGSIIAGNAFLTQSVPPHSVVNRKNEIRPRNEQGPSTPDFVI